MTDFPPFEISSDWPEQVILQANSLRFFDWIDKHIITFGPRYDPEDPATKIATDYLARITDLIRDGRLDPKSPFIEATTEYLKSVAAGQTPATAVRSMPGSRLEGEIEQARRLCFGMPQAQH